VGADREHSPAQSSGKYFHISFRCGRLANRLILFANFVAMAEDQGHRVSNCTFHTYAHLFETTNRDVYCRYPVASQRSCFDIVPLVAKTIRLTRIFYRGVRTAAEINERTRMLGKKFLTLREIPDGPITDMDGPLFRDRIREAKTVFVYGWNFRAPASLERHGDKIRGYFRPMPVHEEASRQTVAVLRAKAEVVIGVHVRHGDYRSWKGGKYFYEAAQYADWMRQLSKQFPGRNVAFLVCSDEARRQEEFPGLTIGFPTGVPVEDLGAMAKCDYIFGPPSTYSQWASFYGNKPMLHVYSAQPGIELKEFRISDLVKIPR